MILVVTWMNIAPEDSVLTGETESMAQYLVMLVTLALDSTYLGLSPREAYHYEYLRCSLGDCLESLCGVRSSGFEMWPGLDISSPPSKLANFSFQC
jgi:hypothetical protein